MRSLALALLLVLLAAPLAGQASRDFDGVNNTIGCGDIATLDSLAAVTVGGWVNSADSIGIIVAKRGGTTADSAWALDVFNDDYRFYKADGSNFRIALLNDSQVDNTWQCVVGTFDTAKTDSVEVELWVAASLVDTENGNNTATNDSSASVTIGRYSGGIGLDGFLAHVFADTRAWKAQEIADYCRGDLRGAMRAHFYRHLMDNAADPDYISSGTAGSCTAAASASAASSLGPPVFIPGGGQ
jgi:hypothetical protein